MNQVSTDNAFGETERHPPWNRTTLVLVAGLVMAAALLRLIGLGQFSFWWDEIHTILVAGVESPEPLRESFHGPEHAPWTAANLLWVLRGPLFAGLVHAWSTVVGNSEASLRLLPAFFAIATVPAFLGLCLRLVERRVALVATFLLVISPFHIWYAQELRGYSLVMLAAVLSTNLLLDLLEKDGRRSLRYAGYAVSLIAGLGASLTMGLLLPVHGLLVIARWRAVGWRRVGGFVLVWVVVMATVSPWLGIWSTEHDPGRMVGQAQEQVPPHRGATTMPVAGIPYAFYAFSVGFSLGPTSAELHRDPTDAVSRHWHIVMTVAVLFGSLALLGARRFLHRSPRLTLWMVLWIAIPFALAAWMAAANVKVWNPRYLFVAYPAFLLFVAAGIGGLRQYLQISALLGVLLLSCLSIWNLRHDPSYGKDDNRSPAAYLDAHLQAQDALIGVDAALPVLFYMSERPDVFTHLSPNRLTEPELRQRIEATGDGRARVWLLRGRAYHVDPSNRVGSILGEQRVRAERHTYTMIELERYDAVPE